MIQSLLEVRNLRKYFMAGRVKAVDGVSLVLKKGQTLGVVGESGSGKSTLARCVLRLYSPDAGEILFHGKNMQAVFQDPYLSLDPRWRIRQSLTEPLRVRGENGKSFLEETVRNLLDSVGLPERYLPRYPHELSGGECQRVAIARALATDPELIVLDEPVSSLDVLVRAQILNLLLDLQNKKGVSYLFISHDLKAVRHMSDEILTMKEGRAGVVI